MGLVATGDAQELLLCAPVFRRNMAAAGTGLTGVLRRHRQLQAPLQSILYANFRLNSAQP